MEKLIKEIDSLMDHIKTDTNKSKMSELGIKLKDLSNMFALAKRQYVRLKVDRDLLEPQLKDQIRQEFETEQARKEIEITEDELKKYKRAKITIDEVEMNMKLKPQYIANLRSRGEQEELVVYLEPLLKAYYEWVQMVKFETNLDK